MGAEWEKEHLWFYLLALGFDPAAAEKASATNLRLGVTAFDTPNYSAFHVVAQFLFAKLDKKRAENTFRNCLLPDVKSSGPEFRKLCNSWLKEIASKQKSGLPRVGTSLFLSPTGRKFIHLMYQFARHVVVEDLRKSSAGSNKPFAEAVSFSPEDMCKADERYRVACNELLQTLLKKDYIIRKYREKSRCLIKEIKQMKYEYAHLQQQLQKMEPKDQNKNDRAEKIQKVRSMWTLIMETFTSLKKEMEIVDSVLENRVDQYILDGTDVVVSVPNLLVDKVENETQEVCTGNLYEDEKLNFLTVIQLLNEALRILRDEYHQFESENHLQPIVNMTKFQNKLLLDLEAVRQIIEKQLCILNESNSRRQNEWRMKWKSSPDWSSLCSQDLDLGVFQAMSEAEGGEDNIFCQNLGSVSDILDLWEINYENDGETLESKMVDSPLTPPRWISSKSSELSEASENRDLLTEKDLHIETYSGKEKPVPPKISEDGKDELTSSESWENTEDHVTQTDAPVKKEDILEKAREELAEEVAKTVTSESPQSGGGNGTALEDLISSLAFNPFLTRNQIPRTPENLLTEIRNSWRKAIQTEGLSEAELVSTKETILAPVDASPTIQDKTANSSAGASSSSAVPDFDYPLSERKSQGSSAEFTDQKQMMVSHTSESLLWETSGMLESKSGEEEKLEDTVSGESFLGKTGQPTRIYVEKNLNTPCISSENNSKMNTLPSNHLLDLVDRDLQWDASPVLSSDSYEVADLGFLHETIPEELNSKSPNKSAMSASNFDFLDSVYVPDNTINKGNTQNLSLGLDSLLSRCEMLKKSASGKGQELCQIPIGDESLSCLTDLSLTSEEGGRDDLCIPLECFSLDEEFTKIPSPVSHPDKNPSLSSLLAFSKHLEEVASNIHEIPLDLIHKLKDKEELNEKLSTKEAPSSLQNLCHRCPHLLTKPYEKSDKPCVLSEYMEKYPLYPSTLPRDSFKPKAEYKMTKTPMEGTSMTRRDYVAYEVLPQKLKEPEKHVKSDESMDLTSVYRQDYNSYPICQVPPCLPRETREISSAKMNTKSTYKDDYMLWKEPKTEMIRPDNGYRPSEAKFDHRTVVQDDYFFRGPVATQSFKPLNLHQKSKAPFENMTNYRVNYVLRPLEKRYVHQYEKYKPSDVPFNGLTTNKISYKGLAGKPAKLAKPYQAKLIHDIPFSSSTEFQEKYQLWPQPPIFTKKPVEYVPPLEKMDLHTTTQLHYRNVNGKPAKMCIPLAQHKKSTEPFNNSSTMKEDYKPWTCKRVKPITHAPELTFPAEPMDCLTTFRTHYLPQPLTLTKSYKPPWPGPRPHIPLGAKTIYATSYTPKGVVKCLASYKNPPGYNFEGTNADGHKFYVPASEEECLQGCH